MPESHAAGYVPWDECRPITPEEIERLRESGAAFDLTEADLCRILSLPTWMGVPIDSLSACPVHYAKALAAYLGGEGGNPS